MDRIYYADRPSVATTQHNAVRLDSILEHSIEMALSDIKRPFYASVVELRDESGEVAGSLLWVPAVTHAELVSDLEDETDTVEVAVDDEIVEYNEVATTHADQINDLERIIEARDKYIEELEAELSKVQS